MGFCLIALWVPLWRGVMSDLIFCVSAILKLAFSVTVSCDNHTVIHTTSSRNAPPHTAVRYTGAHGQHALSLSAERACGNLQSRSIFLLLLAGVALQDVLLPSLSPIFLLTQIFVRTDPGDEPDGPRRLRSGSSCETCDLDHSDRHSTFRLGGGVLSCVRTSPLPRIAQERKG